MARALVPSAVSRSIKFERTTNTTKANQSPPMSASAMEARVIAKAAAPRMQSRMK